MCENLTADVRRIKREMTDDAAVALVKGISDEKGMELDGAEPIESVLARPAGAPKKKKRADSNGGAVEGELWDQMAQITNDLKNFMLNDANTTPRWISPTILE